MKRLVVLISGRGSNLAAIAEAIERRELNAKIVLVVSSRGQVEGLIEARKRNIPVAVIDHAVYPDRLEFDQVLAETIMVINPDWVVLAGFMRILGDAFINKFADRMVNIHPSLLPAYPGLHSHRHVLADGVLEHGATVHLVTNELDGGPVLGRATVPVLADDTELALADRVLRQEHRLYPLILNLLVEGRLRWHAESKKLWLDGEPCGVVQIESKDVDSPSEGFA